jgi:hypothetical protein
VRSAHRSLLQWRQAICLEAKRKHLRCTQRS